MVPNARLEDYRAVLSDLANLFGKKSLHCSKLSHNEICRFAQDMSSLDLVVFGVISRKSTLGDYKDKIGGSDKLYYNKCAQYLLERVGMYLDEQGLCEDDLSVVFEEGNFDYAKLKGLISKFRANPIQPSTRYLKHVNPHSISTQTKEGEVLLELSDLVAHALFRCIDDSPRTFGIRETRYVDELRSRFWKNPTNGAILGQGLYCVHKLSDIKATPPVARFFQDLKSQ